MDDLFEKKPLYFQLEKIGLELHSWVQGDK